MKLFVFTFFSNRIEKIYKTGISKEEIYRVKAHSNEVSALVNLDIENRTLFASGGSDAVIKIWSWSGLSLIRAVACINPKVISLLYLPHLRYLISGDSYGYVSFGKIEL